MAEKVMQLVFGGSIALIVLFSLAPSIANNFGSAVDAFTNISGLSSQQEDTITAMMIVALILFFVLVGYAFYKYVESEM